MTDVQFKEWLDNNQDNVNDQADMVVQYLAGKFESPQLGRISRQLNDITFVRESIPF